MFIIPKNCEIVQKRIISAVGKLPWLNNKVTVTIKKTKTDKISIYFKIGRDVCHTLAWEAKDKIVVLYNVDNQKKITLGKTENPNAYSLMSERAGKIFKIKCMWTGELLLSECGSTIVEHQFVQNNHGIELTLPV